jgi:hypothetical protein
MHAKMLLIDEAQAPSAIVTSANLLKEGYETGIEIGLRLPRGDQRIEILRAFLAKRLELCRQLARSEPQLAKARSVGALKDLSQVVKVAPKVRIF